MPNPSSAGCTAAGRRLVLAVTVFQPNNYDNNKLLYIWHLLGCLLVAHLLIELVRAKFVLSPGGRWGCALAALSPCGSVLTVGREALSDYWQWSADDIAIAIILMTMWKPMQYS